MDKYITTKRAGEILGISVRRVNKLINDDRLPAQKTGRDWLLVLDDVIAFSKLKRGVGRPRTNDKTRV